MIPNSPIRWPLHSMSSCRSWLGSGLLSRESKTRHGEDGLSRSRFAPHDSPRSVRERDHGLSHFLRHKERRAGTIAALHASAYANRGPFFPQEQISSARSCLVRKAPRGFGQNVPALNCAEFCGALDLRDPNRLAVREVIEKPSQAVSGALRPGQPDTW